MTTVAYLLCGLAQPTMRDGTAGPETAGPEFLMYLPVHNGRPRPPRRRNPGDLPVSEHSADLARLDIQPDPERCAYCALAEILSSGRPIADAGIES